MPSEVRSMAVLVARSYTLEASPSRMRVPDNFANCGDVAVTDCAPDGARTCRKVPLSTPVRAPETVMCRPADRPSNATDAPRESLVATVVVTTPLDADAY